MPAPTPLPTPAPTPTPTTAPTPTPTPALAASQAPPIDEPVRRPVLPTRGDVLSADDPEVVRPQCIDCPVAYSPQAERLRIEGDVILALVVDEDGLVTDAKVLRSDNKVLESPALHSVRRWRYRPAAKGGVAGKIHIQVTVQFRL
jgi:TonB family protein